MLFLLTLKSGKPPQAKRGTASSKPAPTHISPAAAVSGAGSPSAMSFYALTEDQ